MDQSTPSQDCGTSWSEGNDLLLPGVHRTFEAVEGREVEVQDWCEIFSNF